jgi:Asp-tRNA(Asn)/Glu-tRNA(Gln) amidotransferase B subunit
MNFSMVYIHDYTICNEQIVEEMGWTQVWDTEAIRKFCEEVISSNPKLVLDYKWNKGKQKKRLDQLIGKVKAVTKVKLDMKKVTEIMEKLLKEK